MTHTRKQAGRQTRTPEGMSSCTSQPPRMRGKCQRSAPSRTTEGKRPGESRMRAGPIPRFGKILRRGHEVKVTRDPLGSHLENNSSFRLISGLRQIRLYVSQMFTVLQKRETVSQKMRLGWTFPMKGNQEECHGPCVLSTRAGFQHTLA